MTKVIVNIARGTADPGYWVYKVELCFLLNWIWIHSSFRDNSSFKLNTLGPLCLWQCFIYKYKLLRDKHFNLYTSVQLTQCTMGQAVEIYILGVHKRKQILHAHLWSENFHSFCKWCKTTKILTWYKILIFKMHILCFLGENWRGGMTRLRFWSLAI